MPYQQTTIQTLLNLHPTVAAKRITIIETNGNLIQETNGNLIRETNGDLI